MRQDYEDIERILLNRVEISKKIIEIGKSIEKDYEGLNPIVIGILKGANIFVADLIREIDIELEVDFMTLSSYGSKSVSGDIEFRQDYSADVSGRHVILVDDIIDTGKTMKKLTELFDLRGAMSCKSCALLDKPSRRTVNYIPDYSGFVIDDLFVVGYGLDYAERFRNLKDICVVKINVYMNDSVDI